MVELCERFGRYGMYSQEHVESEIGRGARPAPRRGAQLPPHRRPLRRDEPVARARGAHQLLPRGVRLRRPTSLIDGIEPFLAPRRLRRRGPRGARPAGRSSRRSSSPTSWSRARSSPCTPTCPSSAGANRKLHPAVAARRDAPLGPVRGLAHADRHRRRVVPRLRTAASSPSTPTAPTARPSVPHGRRQHRDRARHRLACSTASIASPRPTTTIAPLQPGHDARLRRRRALGRRATATPWSPRYDWDELRFSVSWKAYCFADEAERDAWRDHTDDLDARRGSSTASSTTCATAAASTASRPPPRDLALLIIDEYIRFPAPARLSLTVTS